MSGLNDAHRLIAQLFLARNVISDAELKQLVAVGCQVTQQPAMEVGDCVHAINLSLRDLKMEIKSGVSELDGALYFALVGTASDPIAQLATPLEAWQLEFFKQCIHHIVKEAELGRADHVDLLNLRPEARSLEAASASIDFLCNNLWLARLRDMRITLGIRTMLELPDLLSELGLEECIVCDDPVVQAERCSTCPRKMHRHCSENYFAGRAPADIKCPQCSSKWEKGSAEL